MIVATWNINSLPSRLARVLAWLQVRQPDVLCLQELKCPAAQFPLAPLLAVGYQAAFLCERAYNGVAILARWPITDVRLGLADGVPDVEARLVAATVGGVRVLSAYAPHGRLTDSDVWRYKLRWLERLRAYLERHHAPTDPLVLAGDMNVALESRDVHDVAAWRDSVHYRVDARVALQGVVGWGLVDTFRLHHAAPGHHSWWDYRKGSFEKGHGLRIDHVYATAPLARRCVYAAIDRAERQAPHASDHAPVLAAFA